MNDFPRHTHRQGGLRRQVLEDALVAERTSLWEDVHEFLGDWAMILRLSWRIRLISEALGYPTPWKSIPEVMLVYYELIESVPQLGIYAQAWDRDDLEVEPLTIPSDLRAMLNDQAAGFGGDRG